MTNERDYRDVTELPGSPAKGDELRRAIHRHALVRSYAAGRDVLDVACGTGQGLAVIARDARRVIAGDVTETNLRTAKAITRGIPLIRFDAERLPFRDSTFDLLAILEAIYFLGDPTSFLRETSRVLRTGGIVIVGTVNPRWRDFGAAEMSRHYLDSRALHDILLAGGFTAEIFAAFAAPNDAASQLTSLIRRISSALAVPWPSAVRWAIRRAIYRTISAHPVSLEHISAENEPLVKVERRRVNHTHQILYAIGTKRP